jgi:hypothetical protein
MKDALGAAIGALALLAVLAFPVIYVAAPCDKLDWLPAKNTPGRCLEIKVKP